MKPIKDYPTYSVTEEGEVYNSRGWLLKTDTNSAGYHRVTLCTNNKPKKFFVHRLVAQTFIDNPENLGQVNHKDGNKTNNRLDNLEWCTQSTNQYHAHANGLQKRFTKVSEDDVHFICQLLSEGISARTIALALDISRYIPEDIKRGKTWTHISKQYF